jgi:hypothetical protein
MHESAYHCIKKGVSNIKYKEWPKPLKGYALLHANQFFVSFRMHAFDSVRILAIRRMYVLWIMSIQETFNFALVSGATTTTHWRMNKRNERRGAGNMEIDRDELCWQIERDQAPTTLCTCSSIYFVLLFLCISDHYLLPVLYLYGALIQ